VVVAQENHLPVARVQVHNPLHRQRQVLEQIPRHWLVVEARDERARFDERVERRVTSCNVLEEGHGGPVELPLQRRDLGGCEHAKDFATRSGKSPNPTAVGSTAFTVNPTRHAKRLLLPSSWPHAETLSFWKIMQAGKKTCWRTWWQATDDSSWTSSRRRVSCDPSLSWKSGIGAPRGPIGWPRGLQHPYEFKFGQISPYIWHKGDECPQKYKSNWGQIVYMV
jgi:hypothetical protein